MAKKKFKETRVGKFIVDKIPNLISIVGDNVTDSGVLGVVKDVLMNDKNIPEQDKETALKLLEIDKIEMQEVTKRWIADASGSWLTKNVRPLVLLFLTVSFIVGWFMQIEELETVKELMQITFVAYFGGRSFEKIKSK
ncbi:MAG: hypothetical protein GOVbin2181_29 [Prokaryotic dsDNA virus sp.]|nr:MAG: hypothetical protein GOVbin2181_29 [Prokaryotic dsDNA virus sp.]|tara:strand:+ start:18976 stop:19389 length:414 start_codon:yes stop_codon:yes gene_type:complete